jgi:hypothetical protein
MATTPETNPLIEEALERLKLAQTARAKQLKRENEALRFQVPELQWDDDMRASRQAAIVDGVKIPARPMLSIPKLNQPVQLVLNQEKAAHLGVKVSPLSEEATDDTADVLRDLYRREEDRSRAGLARSWAFDRAVKAGTGAYRIDTEWDDESSNPFDQKVVWKRLLYQDAVYFDPTATEPDWSDGEWAFELTWMRLSKLKREFDKADISKYGSEELEALAEAAPDWVKLSDEEGAEPAVLVAVYWRKEYATRAWVVLDDGSFAYEDEIPEGRALHPDPTIAKRREVKVPTVLRSIITATQELNEPEEWNGKYIPLIPVIGVELQPFDGERRWQGVIEPSMDAQRLFNYSASSAVELAATETKAPYLMYEGQDEGFEDMWRQAAVRNFPALKVNKDVTLPGNVPAPLPQRAQVDVGRLGPSMMLLEKADQFIQASTTTLDQTRIEQMGRKRVAHQTIDALQQQSEFGNSHYLHNLATISLPYEAKVVLDLFGKIYDRPGRVARLLDGEDNERTVLLNAPFILQNKRPVPAPQGAPNAKHYDLRTGTYGVSVSIGKSWQNRLQEGSEEIGGILERNPELMPLVGPTYFKFRTFPGSKEIAELLKKLRAKQFPGLDEEEGQQQSVEQLQQQLQQLQQMTQALTQQLTEATDQLKTDFAKQQAQVEMKRIDAQLKVKLQQMQDATAIAVKKLDLAGKGLLMEQQAENEALALQQEQQYDTEDAIASREHDVMLADQQHQQALEQGDQQAGHQADAAEQGHRHALHQQAAKPSNNGPSA